MSASTGVILQDPKSYSVKLQVSETGPTLGTGILVSADGLIVTCVHVLRNGESGSPRIGDTVTVCFPARAGRAAVFAVAELVWLPEGHDDDIACIRTAEPVPSFARPVEALGYTFESLRNRFISYGYRRMEKYHAGVADGVILGEVEAPDGTTLLTEPIQLRSTQINAGMSGAGVLDVERNLVVGIVSEAFFTDSYGKDRDTAWAVNAKVLSLSSLPLELRNEPLPLGHAETPSFDQGLIAQASAAPGHFLEEAPGLLPESIEREPYFQYLNDAYDDDRCKVVGLIGFGGEGKTTIVRHWLDDVLRRAAQPDGVFWWDFGAHPDADQFFDAALRYVTGNRLSAASVSSQGDNMAATVAGMFRRRRFLIILDGLETLQHLQSDEYGAIASGEFRAFLQYMAAPDHGSFLVVTSRAPLIDLAPYTTYQHLAVAPLSVGQGVLLLQRLHITGPIRSMERLVTQWGGHALTLTLLAGYLLRRYGGDCRHLTTLSIPHRHSSQGAKLKAIMSQYDACLTDTERGVLVQCSVFRIPLNSQLVHRFAAEYGSKAAAAETVGYLMATRLVRPIGAEYLSVHPTIRDYYVQDAKKDAEKFARLHEVALRHYQIRLASLAPAESLEQLVPAIEAVHHACGSGEYALALELVEDRLYQGTTAFITNVLNAYDTVLAARSEFFPQGRWELDPMAPDDSARAWILHEVATSLQLLGRPREAAGIFRRALAAFEHREDWHMAAVTCQNLAELYLRLGALAVCDGLVSKCFALAQQADDREDELVAETLRGALLYLKGEGVDALVCFRNALTIAEEATPLPFLYSSSGLKYAEALLELGQVEEADQVSRMNLRICKEASWHADVVQCRIGLADIALRRHEAGIAERGYVEALAAAKRLSRRDVLVVALLGYGRWLLYDAQPLESEVVLKECIKLAALSGYRLSEIDARVAYSDALLALGEAEHALSELTVAEEIAIEIGYGLAVDRIRLAREGYDAGSGS
ncbi:trypsin-like peptidase [Stackebrandtia albiflava]|uniref:Trypsin-like peptidase n=1 Tax=Stackebrandtia albiflava TaxID=406432 RepID=A0A562URN0_9ACTN|nr:trypsin-like peptidase domain-containing protein [Stackebrandtia albiflava]TWJ08261.1 trypsin-like peptidase [Stackebrandtia albiflava]